MSNEQNEKDYLEHYGTPRHSGRYPWGSGEDPFQHEKFYQSVQQLKREGLTDNEIADEFNMTTTTYRALKSVAFPAHKAAAAAQAKEYASMVDENGKRLYSNVQIGKMLGYPDTTIGNMLKEGYSERTTKTQKTIDALRAMVDEDHYIDVGAGAEYMLCCSDTQLRNATKILSESDDYKYELYPVNVRQMGTGLMTRVMVLAPPGTSYSEVVNNKDRIKPPDGGVELYPPDAGVDSARITKYGIKPPVSVSSDRVMINYAEDGGIEKDGVIELRRGVDDISLGNSQYAQVRIAVDGTHYLKGMAVYADDLPEGVDIRFNTNKHKDKSKMEVLKPMKEDDEDNPFGSLLSTSSTSKEAGEAEY